MKHTERATIPKPPDLSDITCTLTSILAEEKEKEKRKLALTIHKVSESTKDSSQSRKAHDLRQINTILQNHLSIETALDKVVHLG